MGFVINVNPCSTFLRHASGRLRAHGVLLVAIVSQVKNAFRGKYTKNCLARVAPYTTFTFTCLEIHFRHLKSSFAPLLVNLGKVRGRPLSRKRCPSPVTAPVACVLPTTACCAAAPWQRPDAPRCPAAVSARRATVFATYFPIRTRHLMVCHAGTARLPRRHGTFSSPAWHVCHAGVANDEVPSENRKVPSENGKAPCFDDANALKYNAHHPISAAALPPPASCQ